MLSKKLSAIQQPLLFLSPKPYSEGRTVSWQRPSCDVGWAPPQVHAPEDARCWFITPVPPQNSCLEEEGLYLDLRKVDLDPMLPMGQHELSLIT